jgi:hypothetical protein
MSCLCCRSTIMLVLLLAIFVAAALRVAVYYAMCDVIRTEMSDHH